MRLRRYVLLTAALLLVVLVALACARRRALRRAALPQATVALPTATAALEARPLESPTTGQLAAEGPPPTLEVPPTEAPPPTPETGALTTESFEGWRVESLTRIAEGAFPQWAPDGGLVAFCKLVDGQYEIFTVTPDGGETTCLTCDRPGLQGFGHRGQPYWHPGGEYITFTAENLSFGRKGVGRTALPGIGRNHDVWIMTSDGKSFWNVTGYGKNWGSIRPSFSHDGKKLYWNEEWSMEKYPGVGAYWDQRNLVLRQGEEVGLWRIKIADLSFGPNGPELSNTRIVPLPSQLTLVEGEGFSPDDQRTVFSACNPSEAKGRCLWGDIYTINLDGSSLTRLTETASVHDENGTYSPDGSRVAWNKAEGLPGTGEELYLMEADGTGKVRLTYFTDPDHPEYDPIARQITELAWSPDGRRMILGHASREQERGSAELGSSLYMLTLGE
jgi:Tol biopolymer transport system component